MNTTHTTRYQDSNAAAAGFLGAAAGAALGTLAAFALSSEPTRKKIQVRVYEVGNQAIEKYQILGKTLQTKWSSLNPETIQDEKKPLADF